MDFEKTTKIDLVEAIYSKINLEKAQIAEVVDSLFDEIKKALAKKSAIELRGFGTFEPRLRKGREKCRNPRTGESVSVDARFTAIFRPGLELKKMMRSLDAGSSE